MELNLISQYFRKLMDALRITGGASRHPKADTKDERLVQQFSALSDGLTIRGKMVFPVAEPARLYPVLVICHGIPAAQNGPPTDDPGYDGMAQDFASLGIVSVIFNFRGCGESDGNFDMTGWSRDLDQVLDKVLNTSYIDPTRVMLLGFSGGGAAAIHSAADNKRIFALASVATPAHFGVFDSTPEDVVKDFRQRGIIRDADFPPDVEKWWSGFGEIEPAKWIAYFEGKHLLIVHGEADELIPQQHAREIYDNAPAGITKLEIIPGGEHKLRTNAQCMSLLRDWFLEVLSWK